MSSEPTSEPLLGASLPGLRRRREAAIVRDAQRASQDALEELFRRHWRRAHRAAFLVVGDSAAAEDIAQESFLAAIRALDRFDWRRPFGPWLHRITVAWRAADQWLFIRPDRPRRVVAVGEISRQFAPGPPGAGEFPSIAGWVLPDRP